MSRRDNKILILYLDFFVRVLFFFPLLLDKFFHRKKSVFHRKILIIELWGIGDLLMMSSILKPLKAEYPHAKVTLLSKAPAFDLFGDSGYVDEFVEYDFPWIKFKNKYDLFRWNWKGLLGIIRRLRREEFDLVLDARGDIRNNLLSFLSGAKSRLGYDWTGGGYFLTSNLKVASKNLHRVDAWLNLLKHLGLNTDGCAPHLSVSKDEEKFSEDFLKSNGISEQDFIVGIHPGARIKTRCWSLDRFAKTAEFTRDNCKSKIIIFLEPEGYGNEIQIRGENFKVKLSLRQLIGLIKKLDLLICNDGGVMHIAGSVNTPVVAIFGPTNPAWFSPYGANNSIIIENDMPCRPCFDYCKYDKVICLDRITVAQVNEVVSNICERICHAKENLAT